MKGDRTGEKKESNQIESNWKEEGKKFQIVYSRTFYCKSVFFSFSRFRFAANWKMKKLYIFDMCTLVTCIMSIFSFFYIFALFSLLDSRFSIPECARNEIIHQKMDTEKKNLSQSLSHTQTYSVSEVFNAF